MPLLDKPIRPIIRKGRERYARDLRLAMRQAAVMGSEKVSSQRRAALAALDKNIQGVGRAIRTETDTCAVAILDSRAAIGGRYHTAVRNELPPCLCTNNVADVAQFIRAKKGPDYFL